MTSYLGLVGSLLASSVALWIATRGWRRSDQRAEQDRLDAAARDRAALLAELLELYLDDVPPGHSSKFMTETKKSAKMKAILLQLPGHLATTLRIQLKMQHTMKGMPLDPASAARLRPHEEKDAGHKWLIFDRASVLPKGSPERSPERIEAELAYDIAGQLGGDQDAVLHALSKDTRNTSDAAVAMLQEATMQRELETGNGQ